LLIAERTGRQKKSSRIHRRFSKAAGRIQL
jgi:hypothetical protein